MVYKSSSNLKINLWLLLIATIFFCIQLFLQKPLDIQRSNYLAPPIEIKYLSFGFATQMSDSFWLRAIQDFDYCDELSNKNECRSKSWLFQVVNLTIELDQYFIEAYYYGALSLSVLISDYEGASIIFDKGVKTFVNDWRLLYAAAYHALFEEKNKVKASELYEKAAEQGAPSWVRLLAGRLAAEGGNNIKAKEILEQLIEIESDPKWIEKLKKKIEENKSPI